jgi:tRNA(adenine34) deaminase
VFGAWDVKAGACGSVWDIPRDPRAAHQVEIVPGVAAAESSALLTAFFQGRR